MNTIESGDKENKSTKKARPSRPASSSTKKTAPTKHPIQEKLDKIAALEKEISAVIDQREDVVALVREGDEAREEWERSVARYEFLAAEEKKSEAAIDELANEANLLREKIASMESPQFKKYIELVEAFNAANREIEAIRESGDEKRIQEAEDNVVRLDEATDSIKPLAKKLRDLISEHNTLKWFTMGNVDAGIQHVIHPDTWLDEDEDYSLENVRVSNAVDEIGEDNIVEFTSNGVILVLENPDAIEDGKENYIDAPEARFSIVGPDNTTVKNGLTIEQAYDVMEEAAVLAQTKTLENFNAIKNPVDYNKKQVKKTEAEIDAILKEYGFADTEAKTKPASAPKTEEPTTPAAAPKTEKASSKGKTLEEQDKELFTEEELALLAEAKKKDEDGLTKAGKGMEDLKNRSDFDYTKYKDPMDRFMTEIANLNAYETIRGKLLEKKKTAAEAAKQAAAETPAPVAESSSEEAKKIQKLIDAIPDGMQSDIRTPATVKIMNALLLLDGQNADITEYSEEAFSRVHAIRGNLFGTLSFNNMTNVKKELTRYLNEIKPHMSKTIASPVQEKKISDSTKNLEYGPVFYMGEPMHFPEGDMFVKNSKSTEYKQGYVVYKFLPIENSNRAEFEFISDEATMMIPRSNNIEHMREACRFIDSYPSEQTKKVTTIERGEAELLPDGNWRITKKAKVRFE